METLAKYNDQLMGAPAGVLVFFACIAFGYVVRVIPFIRNDYIPVIVIMAGSFMFPMISQGPGEGESMRVWIVKHSLIGLIIGLVAWFIHDKVISKVEDKLIDRIPLLRGVFESGDKSKP